MGDGFTTDCLERSFIGRRPLDNEISECPEAEFRKNTLGNGGVLKGSRWGQGETMLTLSFLVSFWALGEPRQTDAQMEL